MAYVLELTPLPIFFSFVSRRGLLLLEVPEIGVSPGGKNTPQPVQLFSFLLGLELECL